MSEKMAEEGGATAGPSGIVKFKDNFVKITKDRKKQIFIGFKSVELILSFIATALEIGYSFSSDSGRGPIPNYKSPYADSAEFSFRVVSVALNGFLIFNLILLASYLFGDQLPKKMLSMFAFLGAIFCLVAGIILILDTGDSNYIHNQEHADELVASGIFAILAALTFAAESIITYFNS